MNRCPGRHMDAQIHGHTDTGTHIHTHKANIQTNKHTNTHTLAQIIMKPCKALRMDATGNLHLSSDLIKNEPDALLSPRALIFCKL